MRIKRLKLTAILLIGLGPTGLQAQEAISASGSGGSVSYTVGQIVYQTHTGTSGSVAEGVQQPYEISVVTAIKETEGINLEYKAYPNPATDYIILKVKDYNTKNLLYQLYDINGKLLESNKLTNTETGISMDKYASTIYLLKVIDNQQEVKIFKIIKK